MGPGSASEGAGPRGGGYHPPSETGTDARCPPVLVRAAGRARPSGDWRRRPCRSVDPDALRDEERIVSGLDLHGDPWDFGLLPQDLGGERLVVVESSRPATIVGDRHAVARRLAELDAVPHDGLEEPAREVTTDLL